ncbi:activator of 90 kDa heat shock protein ATPase homolog 2-like [Papaver somniferum]|uniref:activator of 90 kDa heat shock protein ATPase homolog 2-like n=1 Tax=Papaver somniferum TaxID=3469 RepID=UPI000E70164E|nr:activator of 90 kDa heat shock protein ATPase homolog 2-like [Papaver somniferum]
MENGGLVAENIENDNNNHDDGSSSSAAGGGSSYTYWVRRDLKKEDAAPLPAPRKLTPQDVSTLSKSNSLGSVWNQAGTWEEKNLNSWASGRIKELMSSLGSLEFSSGKAEIAEVTKCVGDAFLVTVRNKKRVGYTYELTLRFKGDWLIGEEKKHFGGHLDVPEFSFGEVDDMEVEIRLNQEKDIAHEVKMQVRQDLKLFLKPIREKMLEFEQELKDR